MSAAAATDFPSAERVVAETVRRFVAEMGQKQGLWAAAQALGIGPRTAKAAAYGEPFRADANLARRAAAARVALIEQRRDALARELEELRARLEAL